MIASTCCSESCFWNIELIVLVSVFTALGLDAFLRFKSSITKAIWSA